MKVLLLGVGMQGKAALHDLVHSAEVTDIVAADRDITALRDHVESQSYGGRVRSAHVDAADPESVRRLIGQRPDVVVDLLPVPCHREVTVAAVEHGAHLVNSSYTTPEIRVLEPEARARGIRILPELGMDPGLDLVLLGEAVRALDEVEEIVTYGAGFPEPEAADNPLKYKVTWAFEGVLRSYRRAARVIRDGKIVDIRDTEIFCPENLHEIDIDGVGRLEAFPNGDVVPYVDLLGMEPAQLRTMGRYVLRWPGHGALWKTLVDLHLLDDEPVMVDGMAVDRRRLLAGAIEPHIRDGAQERDVVVVRVEVKGRKGGNDAHAVYQVTDRRDLETGYTAMSRTVGYAASIGAQMIGAGRIAKSGVLSPVIDIPFRLFAEELRKREIRITSQRVIGE